MTSTATATRPATPAATALAVYDAALRLADAGRPVRLSIRDGLGREHPVDAAAWCRPSIPGDAGLLDRCAGPTLDVGCGPGRLLAALSSRGCATLGVDISATAVRLARLRGAMALRRDVFDPLPGLGRWQHVLLADGNIGIAGDPVGLLCRCRALLARGGRLHVEVSPPGTDSWVGPARIRLGDGAPSAPFRWAAIAADDLAVLAADAALRAVSSWTEAGRWFVSLARD